MKKLSPAQKKIARTAKPYNKITGADFKALKRKKKKKMKSRGLGDYIHKLTTRTGVKSAVDFLSKGLNIPCGCEGRREAMNKLFPKRYK